MPILYTVTVVYMLRYHQSGIWGWPTFVSIPTFFLSVLIFRAQFSYYKNHSENPKRNIWLLSTFLIFTATLGGIILYDFDFLNPYRLTLHFFLVFLFAVLSLLGTFSLFFYGIKNGIVRPKQFFKLAKKYGLAYNRKSSSPFSFSMPFWAILPENDKLRWNILEGNIRDKHVIIYDLIDPYYYPIGGGFCPRRCTIISIDGKEQEYGRSPVSYYSVSKIEKILSGL